jgi:prepilin-type N-terminal cleavage/methylation domain-containing protein
MDIINMMTDYSPKEGSRGFTLIELVVAILIFAIGIVGIMKMHQASIQANSYSMQLTQAMNIVEDKIDFLRGIPFTNAAMTVGNHAAVATSMGVQYNLSWSVAATAGSDNHARSINVTIAWMEKAISHQVSIPVILSPL